MIAHLLVVACACALGMTLPAPAPPYCEANDNMEYAIKILTNDVISMEGDIPLLNDTRRQYAEMFKVINDEAILQSGCLHAGYYEEYQRVLKESAPASLTNPQGVIDNAHALLKMLKDNTNKVKELINNRPTDELVCDQYIQNKAQNDPEIAYQASVLLQAGEVSNHLKKGKMIYDEVANQSAGHGFVIQRAAGLEQITLALADLFRLMNRFQAC